MKSLQLSSLLLQGRLALAALALAAVAGCGEVQAPKFQLNLQGRNLEEFVITGLEGSEAEARVKEQNAEAKGAELKELVAAATETAVNAKKQNIAGLNTIATILYAFFGEPNAPYVAAESGLDLHKVKLASGPSGGDDKLGQRGLYRQHCAHCHGINGDGAGPTAAFLNPYPRDYRLGLFKFKSTERAARPTNDDLKRILREGIAGTAMPSFLLLPDDEIDALVEYVKYLSMRGETETLLALTLLTNGDTIDMNRADIVDQYIKPIAKHWAQAESKIIVPAERPPLETEEQRMASLAKGEELFRGAKAQCAKCHGPTAMGDGSEERLFDDWNKVKKYNDITKNIAAAEQLEDKGEAKKQLKELYHQLQLEERSWLLPQQEILPRNLRLGIYRFGRTPADHYRRIFAGINGTPMPQGGADASNPSGLTPEEIWHIVTYVRSLPYEKFSEPYVGKGRLAGLDTWHE